MPPPTNFLMAVLLWLAFVLPAFSQPINDDCAGAIPLTVHGDLNCYYPQSVLTTGSTPSLPASTCMDKGDVWFRFKAVQSTHHLALQQATSALTGDVLPVQIELFSGACGNLNSFDCWADVRQYSNNTLKIHSLQPGQTYYVRVAQPDDIPIRLSMCLLTPPPPPVNDECASAVELMPASSGVSCALVSGTTHHATRSLGVPAPPCCESGDVWYRFTAAAYAHELTLNSEWWKHGANPYVRVRAEVFSGSNCQTFTPLGAVSAGYYFSNTAYLINLTPGATYWVRVYAEDDTDANFNICVTTPRAPDNDECDAALPFPVNEGLDRNQFFSISGYAASPSALPSGCSNKAVNDTWYAFTATTERYRFEIYKAYTEGGPMNLEILSGDCAQPTSLMCRSSDENYVVFEQGGFTPGSTYYVRTWCSGFLKQSIFGVALALPAPPPNDECAQAILLPANSPLPCTATVTGTTLAASTSLNDCDGKAVQDVWYRFTAEGTSNLLQINALKGYFDYPGLSGFEVLEGTDCADASSVFCQNDLQNRINWVLPELKTGHTYLLRLFSQALRAQDFSLCLSVLGQPANDRCTSATEVLVNPDLGCSWSVAGSLAGATGESVPEQSDVWYQFTALHSVHLIHLRDVVVLYGSTGYLRCQVYAGAACDGGTLVSEFDPTTTMHVEGLVPGAAYALRVFSLDPDMAYRFDLCIRSLPPAPSNISCASAAPLTINPDLSCAQVLHGTTAGTPGKVGYGLGCSISWWERPIHELWYSFTALTSTHRIELSGVKAVTGFDSGRFAWSVLNSDDCVAFDNSLACGEGEGKALLRNLTPGRTYYILISSDYDDVAHDFDLCVSTYPAPANDDCIHATVLTVSADAGCQNVVSGTLVSASPSPEALLCGSPQNDVWYTFTATGPAHTVYVTKPFIAPAEVSIYQTFSVAVYGGADCSQLKPLACGSPMYYSAYMSLGDLVPGMQYWVRVVTLGADLNFDICIGTLPEPTFANDQCAQAITLPVSPDQSCQNTVSGNTMGAVPSVPVQDNYSYGVVPLRDVWYTFSATQPNHVVKLAELSPNYNYFYLNAKLYSGACGSLTLHPYQRFSYSGLEVTNLTPGETYYVQIGATTETDYSFALCVISPPAPTNDECAGATPLTINTDLKCQSVTYTDFSWATQSAPGCAGEAVTDQWFSFQPISTSCRIDLGQSTGSGGIFGWEVLEGDCDALTTLLACTQFSSHTTVQTLQNLTPGKTYYLRVSAQPLSQNSVYICIRSLPAPPDNDNCAQAIALEVGMEGARGATQNGTTLSSTGTGKTCDGYDSQDVWYSFVAKGEKCLAEINVSSQPIENSWGYLGLTLYRGPDCSQPTEMQCFPNLQEDRLIFSDLISGETYFLRVFSQQNQAQDFSICLSAPASNATCDAAIEVMPSTGRQCIQPMHGSTKGLTQTEYSPCYSYYNWWSGYVNPLAMWYRFTASSSVHVIQLNNMVQQAGSEFLGLELSASCGGGGNIRCSSNRELVASALEPGTTYYIRLSAWPGTDIQFDLCILTPEQPNNDLCSDAIPLPVSPGNACAATTAGTTFGATGSYDPFGCYTGPDVLYSFTATYAAHQIHVSKTSAALPYAFIQLLEGPCGNWTDSKACTGFNTGNNLDWTVGDLTPGKEYFIRIGNEYPAYFDFEICVTTPLPDASVYVFKVNNSGCRPDKQETVYVEIANEGASAIASGAAQVTLTLSGANTGTYGPQELGYIPTGVWQQMLFQDVDLSNPGVTQLTVTVSLSDDPDPSNNSSSITFSSLPLLDLYQDADQDGYGDPGTWVQYCWPLNGYVANNTDCDDTDPSRNPDAPEICNGLDDDCDGLTDAADPDLSDAPVPEIACPEDLSVYNDPGICSAIITYPLTTTDHCGYTLTQDEGLASGSAFPLGTTINRFTLSGFGGSSATCAFHVTVEKKADPDLLAAYTIIGLNDVYLQNNQVQSGGIGVVNAGKKARLQGGTTVTAASTFVKAPVLELMGNSQVASSLTGQVPAALLPAFKVNATPSTNNLSIPANAGPTTLPLESYGVVTVGTNSTIVFSGKNSVRIKELSLKEGAKVIFAQPTEVLISGLLSIGRSTQLNAGGTHEVRMFVGKNITVNTGANVWANLYTQQDLRLEKATAALPISMTGQFIGLNVYALDYANWNWDATRCPAAANAPLSDRQMAAAPPTASAVLGEISLSPNPTALEAQVQFDLHQAAEVLIEVLDLDGHTLYTQQAEGIAGQNRQPLRLANMGSGTFIVQLSTQGERRIGKLVVLRP